MGAKSKMPTTAPPAVATPAPVPAPDAGLGDATAHGNAAMLDQMAARQGGTRRGAPRTRDEADQRQTADVAALNKLLASAASVAVDPSAGLDSRANLFHNSAEWITSGNVDTYVLSRVHDEHKRPSVPEGMAAYYDTRTAVTFSGTTGSISGTPTYDDSVGRDGKATNDAGLLIEPNTTLAGMENDAIAFFAPSRSNEGDLVETIIHEVQHDADQHDAGPTGWSTAGGGSDETSKTVAPTIAWTTYQSEVRAYWLQSPEGSSGDDFLGVKDEFDQTTLSTTDPVSGNSLSATTKFKNARQMNIFLQLINQSGGVFFDPDTQEFNGPYGYVGHYYVIDRAFRTMVDGFDVPGAGNAINSVRIHALSVALAGGVWASIKAAAEALDPLDRTYLQDRRASNHLWAQADAALGDEQLAEFETAVGPVMGPWQSARVTTRRGDTLEALADRFLEDVERWEEFRDVNPGVRLPRRPKEAIRAGLELEIPKG